MTLGRPGDLLADRYRLDRFVGAAGSVERWQAYDERLARPVTARLEPAPGDTAEQDESTAAAQAALTRVAQLNSPGVAAVYDVGTADGLRNGAVGYAISEWTEGRTLAQIMAAGPQPWQRTADWGRQLSGALAALHGIGLAHGALSPESVAIHDDRQVKILDAGVDSVPSDGADGELPAGAPNDIYALGFMLWEATAGAAPEYVIPAAGAATDAEAAAQAAEAKAEADGEGESEDRGDEAAAQGAPVTEPLAVPVAVAGADREFPHGTSAPTAATEPLATPSAEPTVAGIDQEPLLDAGAPAEFAALLAAMLAADAAQRPTAAEAERRFAPFAVERVSDTLPGVVAAAAAPTQVLGPPVAGAAAAVAAAEAAKADRERRRGAMLGLALLVAAVLAGLGFLLANLSSHSNNPNEVNTTVPSSSPGMVVLPNGSLSPAPSRTQTGGGRPTGAAQSTSAGSSPTGQAPTSAPASGSAPASPTAGSSSAASSPASVGGGASTPSAPVSEGATPSSSAHIRPNASAADGAASP
jgi:serine/threonine-protein kinase